MRIPLLEESAFVGIFGGGSCAGSCEVAQTVFVHPAHLGGLGVPVVHSVLENAQRVDPDIPDRERSGYLDGIDKGLRERFERNTAPQALDVGRLQLQHLT